MSTIAIGMFLCGWVWLVVQVAREQGMISTPESARGAQVAPTVVEDEANPQAAETDTTETHSSRQEMKPPPARPTAEDVETAGRVLLVHFTSH
jgi:hypothetical protein